MVANASHPSSTLFDSRRQRAFATHPHHSRSEAAFQAGILLKGRSFQADKHNSRKTPAYWLKLEYPFWWNNLLSALWIRSPVWAFLRKMLRRFMP